MMKDNDLLMVVIAFVIGFMLQGMMKNMCGQRRLMEGKKKTYMELTKVEREMMDQGFGAWS